MPIVGLSDRGMDFPQIGNIRKGSPKGPNGQMGRELPHWRFEFDETEQAAATKLAERYGDKPTWIDVVMPFKSVDDNIQSWLEAYTNSMMVARSDGARIQYMVATSGDRKGEVIVQNGEPETLHPPDNIAGYDQSGKPVKFVPVMRLKVIIPALTDRAAYLVVHSGSKLDIVNLTKQLRFYHEFCGGSLQGVPFLLKRVPKMVSVPNPKKPGTKMRVKKHLIALELHPAWFELKQKQLAHSAIPQLEAGALVMETSLEEDDEEDFIIEGEVEEEGPAMTADPVPPQPVEPAQVEELVEKINGMMAEAEADAKEPTPFDKTDLPRKKNMDPNDPEKWVESKRPYDPYTTKVRLARKMEGQKSEHERPTKQQVNGLTGAFASVLGFDRNSEELFLKIQVVLNYLLGVQSIEDMNDVQYRTVRENWMEAEWKDGKWNVNLDAVGEIAKILAQEEGDEG